MYSLLLATSTPVGSFLLGDSNKNFAILLCVMAIDVTTGLIKAYKNKRLASYIMTHGLYKKAGIILAILLCLLLDALVNSSTPTFGLLMTWVAIGNEALSIAENLKALGVNLPQVVLNSIRDISEIEKEVLNESYLERERLAKTTNQDKDLIDKEK